MQNYTFNWEIRTLVASFCNAFNEVVIKRYDQQGTENNIEDQIHVNFVYAPKNRVLHDLVNKAKHIKLPVISVSINFVNRAEGRVFNKLEGPYYDLGEEYTGFSHPLQPVPVDIGVNMSVITRFQSDMDQILTNFVPYNDPYIVMSWREPYTGFEIRTPVQWSNNISLNYPLDINATQQFRQTADTSFTIQGWLFKKAEEPTGKIYKIETTFNAVSSINHSYDILKSWESETTTDYFTSEYNDAISAQPQITDCIPYLTVPCVSGKTFTIKGDMFDMVTNLYVSGNGVYPFPPSGYPVSSYNLLSSTHMLYHNPALNSAYISSSYLTGFSGVEIGAWNLISNNEISFTLPTPLSAGYINVIAYNEAGYGNLMADSVRPTLNPYPSGSEQYNNYVEYQPPVISGIQVLDFDYNCNL